LSISLEHVRTDGWFERVAQKVGSLQVLCEVLGERFFAFSLITGAQITSLTVDRGVPSQSIVEFLLPGQDESDPAGAERLSIAAFREYLVAELLEGDEIGEAPTSDDDLEATRLYLGARLLLLAPLFGYSLLELGLAEGDALLRFVHTGQERELNVSDFRAVLERWVLEELERAKGDVEGDSFQLDPALVPEARKAAASGDHAQVIALLGGWLMPLSFFLRTPQARQLAPAARAELADGLGLLGEALTAEGDPGSGHHALRLAVQFALGGPAASAAYLRLGEALYRSEAFGQAIAPLRRAAKLGAAPERVWPALCEAFLREHRHLAAWGAARSGIASGVEAAVFAPQRREILERLPLLAEWSRRVGEPLPQGS
jgi:hypothetical protein